VALVFNEYTGAWVEDNPSQFPMPNIGADYPAPNNVVNPNKPITEVVANRLRKFESWNSLGFGGAFDGYIHSGFEGYQLSTVLSKAKNKYGATLLIADACQTVSDFPVKPSLLVPGIPNPIDCGFCITNSLVDYATSGGVLVSKLNMQNYAHLLTTVTNINTSTLDYIDRLTGSARLQNTIDIPPDYDVMFYSYLFNIGVSSINIGRMIANCVYIIKQG